MSINFDNVSSAYATINGVHKKVNKVFETINGVWVLVYEGSASLDENLVLSLIDFEYTDNGDGTVTLTAWKGTLNGIPGTKIVIPDDNRIIL